MSEDILDSIHEQEAEWLASARRGDDAAFSNLVETYQRPVYNLCYRMLGNQRDAEDAAQETFIKAYNALHRYDSARKFSTWLLTIASNYCIDQHRRKKLPTFSYDSLPVPDLEQKSPRLDTLVIDAERQADISELLEILGPNDRAAVIMRYWYDYSYEEIADALSLTLSAVKSRLHRARRDLSVGWISMQDEQIIDERTQYETTA